MSSKLKVTSLAIGAAFAVMGFVPAQAATMVWSPTVSNISAASDILTTGTLKYAVYFMGQGGGPGDNRAVNGVTFNPVSFTNSIPVYLTYSNVTAVNYVSAQLQNGSEISLLDNPSGIGLSNYGQIIRHSLVPTVGANPVSLTLSDLTAGQAYLLQVWYENPNVAGPSSTYTVAGTTSALVDSNVNNVNGGLGQFTTGIVTLGAGETSFTLTASAGISMLQLRAIPEPSTVATLAFGGVIFFSLAYYRRRRVATLA